MKFVKKVFSYAIGNGLSKFIAVIILPIYTNYLNPQEYGKADLAYYTVSIIVSFAFMECWTALLRFIYDDYTSENRKKVFSNIVFLSILLLIPYILLQYLVSIFIAKEFAWLSCIYGVVYLITQILQIYARAIKDTKTFVVSGVVNSVVQLIVACILTMYLKVGATIVLIAPIMGALGANLYLIFETKCIKDISFHECIDKKLLKNICVFCIPLAFNSIAFWAMNNINRYFAAYFIGYEASSFVSIASKLTMIITLAASVYSLAWQENAFENSNNQQKNQIYTKMFRIYIFVFSVATIFSILFVKLIFPIIIGSQYNATLEILPTYFVAVYFSGISSFLGQIFGAEKKTLPLLSSTIVGTITNLIIVVALIKKINILAIPIGSLLGYLNCTIMRYISLHKTVQITINMKEIGKALSLIFISFLMFYFQQGFFHFIIFAIILLILVYFLYNNIIKETFNKLLRREQKK